MSFDENYNILPILALEIHITAPGQGSFLWPQYISCTHYYAYSLLNVLYKQQGRPYLSIYTHTLLVGSAECNRLLFLILCFSKILTYFCFIIF